MNTRSRSVKRVHDTAVDKKDSSTRSQTKRTLSKNRSSSPKETSKKDVLQKRRKPAVGDEKNSTASAKPSKKRVTSKYFETEDVKPKKLKKETNVVRKVKSQKQAEQIPSTSKAEIPSKPVPNYEVDSDDDDSDWEEVGEMYQPQACDGQSSANGSLEITLSSEQTSKKVELTRILHNALRRLTRANREKMHQITLLSFMAHALAVSKMCNTKLLQSLALSLIPNGFLELKSKSLELEHLMKFLKWFRSAFVLSSAGFGKHFISLESHVTDLLATKTVGDFREAAYLFVLLARAMGWPCRFVMSLSTSSFQSFKKSNAKQPIKNDDEIEAPSCSPKENGKTRDAKSSKIQNSKSSKVSVKSIEDTKQDKTCDFWAEVYLESREAWIPANYAKCTVNECESVKNGCTQPIVYVITVDNDHAMKDVTVRYNLSAILKSIRRLRLKEDWWQETLSLKMFKPKPSIRDRLEDAHLEKAISDVPFPKSMVDFKHHPIYVLKRDLLKFEIIYPLDTEPVGTFRNEPVYPRDAVHTLHTKETWLKEARSVKENEQPPKLVKGRPKNTTKVEETDRMIAVFGKWQTRKYIPPVAKDGIVPRNQYGNVDLFKPCMLPRGTVHLKHPGMLSVAKKLGMDCAQAMIGWDFHGGWSHPVFDGVVVCREHEKTLVDAWKQERSILIEKANERKSKRALKNWIRLVKALLLREKVESKFGGKLTKNGKDDEKVDELKKDGETTECKTTEPNWLKNCDEFLFTGH